jgi:hypothetical protein
MCGGKDGDRAGLEAMDADREAEKRKVKAKREAKEAKAVAELGAI